MSTAEVTPIEAIHERAGTGSEILRLEGLVKHFPIRAGVVTGIGRASCRERVSSVV